MILLTGRTQISPLPFQVSHIKFILPGSGILCRSHDPDVSTVAVLWVFYCTMMPFWLILKEEKSTSSDTTSAVDVSCWPGRILNFPPQEWQNSSGTTELQDAYYSRWLQTVLPVLSNSSVRRTDHTNRLTKIQNSEMGTVFIFPYEKVRLRRLGWVKISQPSSKQSWGLESDSQCQLIYSRLFFLLCGLFYRGSISLTLLPLSIPCPRPLSTSKQEAYPNKHAFIAKFA